MTTYDQAEAIGRMHRKPDDLRFKIRCDRCTMVRDGQILIDGAILPMSDFPDVRTGFVGPSMCEDCRDRIAGKSFSRRTPEPRIDDGSIAPVDLREVVSVSKGTVLTLIDLALSADECGSGSMCDDDVDALRAAAIAAGIDPMRATPGRYQCRYRLSHAWGPWFPEKVWLQSRGAWVVESERRICGCGKQDTRPVKIVV